MGTGRRRFSPIQHVLIARGLRAFGDGFVSLLLPLYLLELGLGPFAVGVLATATLCGSGVLTVAVGAQASRHPYRRLLLASATLMAATGLAFAVVHDFWPLLAIAIVGTLNPSSGDVSVFVPLEHAVLAQMAPDRRRTAVFARYSLVGALAAAAGSLAAGLPTLLLATTGVTRLTALQAMFALYAALGGGVALTYRGLPATRAVDASPERSPLRESRRKVYTLAALFSLDAFGGGFVVQSLLALWLYQRHGMSAAAAGTLFFWAGLLAAASYVAAARLADRFGLVNTMVFTHIPSSLCLLAMPFVPDLRGVIALLLVRSALSQMDVPTRSSYVMAIVTPHERPAAASVTSVPRSLAAAASPVIAGYLLGASAFGWPLVVGGTVKIVYDLLLLAAFGRLRPPEEAR
jgi:MFS family permease